MAMNTAYLSMNTSAQSNINSPFITSGVVNFSNTSSAGTMWVNDLVVRGSYTTTGAVAFGSTVAITSTLTVGGVTTLSSAATIIGPLNVNSGHTQANFLSYQTTASATSAILPDGAFGVYFESVTSARLCFRSGVTTYTWIATTGGVL